MEEDMVTYNQRQLGGEERSEEEKKDGGVKRGIMEEYRRMKE